MKFLKEKQRFSLRNYKAYGLSSALLGLTLVGTSVVDKPLLGNIVSSVVAQAADVADGYKNVLTFNVANGDIKTITKNIKEHKPTDFLVVMEMSSATPHNAEKAFLDDLIRVLDKSMTDQDRVMVAFQGWPDDDVPYTLKNKDTHTVVTKLVKWSELKSKFKELRSLMDPIPLKMDSTSFAQNVYDDMPETAKRTLNLLADDSDSMYATANYSAARRSAKNIIQSSATISDYRNVVNALNPHDTLEKSLYDYLSPILTGLENSASGTLSKADLELVFRKILITVTDNLSIQKLFDDARGASSNERDRMLMQYLNTVRTSQQGAQDFYKWVNDNQISSYFITAKQQSSDTMSKLNHKYSTEKNFLDAVLNKTTGNNAVSTTYEVQQASIDVNVTPEEGLTLTSATLVKGDLRVQLPITNNRVDYQTQGDVGDYTVEYTFSGKPTTEKSIRSSVSVNGTKKDEHVNTVKPVEEQFNTTYEDDASLVPGTTADKTQGVTGLKYVYLKDGREVGTEIVRNKVDKVVRRGVAREEVVEEDVPVPVTTTYTEDNQLAYGNNPIQSNGKAGVKHVRKVYTLVNGQRSGEPKVTETVTTQMQPKVVQIGTKPTVVETPIARKTVYQGDIAAAPGTVNESEAGRDGKTITTTAYTFNAQNGTATPNKPTTTTEPAVNKVVKKGTKPKVEHVMKNGVKVRKTTNYTVNSETGAVTESVSYALLKSTELTSTDDALATGNTWEKRERLTDQAVPIEKITTYTMRPENGDVTTSVRYEIVNGQGAKKDTLDTTEDVAGKEVPVVKKGHHLLNTETGKLTSTIQYARKDGQANVWETTEPFNTNGVSGNKITKYTLNPSTGDITKEVLYEIDKSAAVKAIEAKVTAKNKEIEEAGLNPEDVTALKQQVEAEKTKAIDNVKKANAVEDVIVKRDEGIIAIGNISLDAAKQRKADKDKGDLVSALQTAKNNALKELEAAAKAKVDEIEKADILPEDKDLLKQRVASEKEKATKAINEATTPEGVAAKLNDGKAAIAGIGLDEAKQRKADKDKADLAKSLEQAKLDAIKAIEVKATAKNKEIDEAGLNPEDVTALKQQVEAEKTKAIDNVNKANNVKDVIVKRDEGIIAIGNISLDAAKQRKDDGDKALALQTAKDNALKEIEKAVKVKLDEIENADILPADKEVLKQRVVDEKEKAIASINSATTPEGVTAKLNDGKAAIESIAVQARQDSGNKVTPLVREELPAYHGTIEDAIEEFEFHGVQVRKITKYAVNEDGTVSSKVEYRFENGKSEFDQVEEIEEQGIKIRKVTHYAVNENGEVSFTVRYELLDGSLEFDKVENVKDGLNAIERTTHYKLNPETGKFETTVSDKVLFDGSKKELPAVPQKQLPNTGDASIVLSAGGMVLMGIGALARPRRKK